MRDMVSEIQNDIESIGLYDYLCAVLKAVNRVINSYEADGFAPSAKAVKEQGDKLDDLLLANLLANLKMMNKFRSKIETGQNGNGVQATL